MGSGGGIAYVMQIMGNTFLVPCPETMETHQKLFLGSIKTSHGNIFYTIMALDC